MTVMMENSMEGATPAHRGRKQVSACVSAPMAPQAEVCMCGRARAGIPLRTSSLLPWKMAAHWSQWAPNPRRGGEGFEEAIVAYSSNSSSSAHLP
eukprot:7377131-Prymnesium_polylepis.1